MHSRGLDKDCIALFVGSHDQAKGATGGSFLEKLNETSNHISDD